MCACVCAHSMHELPVFVSSFSFWTLCWIPSTFQNIFWQKYTAKTGIWFAGTEFATVIWHFENSHLTSYSFDMGYTKSQTKSFAVLYSTFGNCHEVGFTKIPWAPFALTFLLHAQGPHERRMIWTLLWFCRSPATALCFKVFIVGITLRT